MRVFLVTTGLLLVGVISLLWSGNQRWRATSEAARQRLEATAATPEPPRFDPAELAGLPLPVTRYFRTVMRPGQPMIAGARLEQSGQFRPGESDTGWKPFSATESFVTRPAGFLWEASIRMFAGVPILVRDGYRGGVGSTRAEILGLVKLLHAEGAPELAQGALQRYLAESVWFPTALLPSQGVRWQAIDDTTARATLADGSTQVAMEFHFGSDGTITSAYASDRMRQLLGSYTPSAWACRYFDYAEKSGVRIPTRAEAEWRVGQPFPYWRGRITDVNYRY